MKKQIFIAVIVICIEFVITSAQAHMLWINLKPCYPKVGETVWIEIGWGHKYPRDQVIEKGLLEQVYAIDPKGKRVALKKIFPSFYKFVPNSEGIYLIVAKLRSGFVSITTEGHKLGNKKQLKNVVSCFKHIVTAEAIIKVGDKKRGFSRLADMPLEIVPLKDPFSLKIGDVLPLKIVFKGKPLAGEKLYAIHIGYKRPIEANANLQGIVNVKIDSQGEWMFRVIHKSPYPDKSIADEYLYGTSLTFCFKQKRGKVYIIGMGPAGPDLLTLRAIEVLKKADIILCSNSMLKDFRELIPASKVAFDLWKGIHGKKALELRKKDPKKWHARIEKRKKLVQHFLLEKIKEGKTVAILERGDPCVFGPSLYWLLEGFDDQYIEIVPGMSAFNAAAALLKRPMTGRGVRFVMLTSPFSLFGKTDKEADEILRDLSKYNITMVFYMALGSIERLVKKFKKYYPPDLPIAVVYYAGYSEKEKVLRSTFSTILEDLKGFKKTWLALVIVGKSIK